MDIKQLQDIVKNFCEEREWTQYHNPKDLAIGISTEAGELLDLFRFKSEEQMEEIMNTENKKEKVENEVADVLFFLLRFAQMNDIDLVVALKNKMAKNSEKYQVEKVRGKNLKYNEYESEE